MKEKRRALVFTFNDQLYSLTELLLKSVDYDFLNYDIYGLYLPSEENPTCKHDFNMKNLVIEPVELTTSSENIYAKDCYDSRMVVSRNPLRNNWIKMISAQWFESRKILYEKAATLIKDGYNQVTVTDADFFITDPDELHRVLSSAPGDTITCQLFENVTKAEMIPDMLESNEEFVNSIPDYDRYYKMDGECIHTVTVSSESFREKVIEFYIAQGNITPGDWMWDMWRLGIAIFITKNKCANIITRDHQLSFVFAAISYCIEGVTADHEPTDWVMERSAIEILDAVYKAVSSADSLLRKVHSCHEVEEYETLMRQIEVLKTKW